MPWEQREYICSDCGQAYWTSANNTKRCRECARAHENEVRRQRLRERRGENFGKQGRHPPMSNAARFNMMMAKSFKQARCPVCSKHMRKCRCNSGVEQEYAPPKVATWKPWE